jgi:hypothetical protein
MSGGADRSLNSGIKGEYLYMAKPVILALDDPQVLRADSGKSPLDTLDNSSPKSSARVEARGWTSSGASSPATVGKSRSTPGRAGRASWSVCR